MTDWCDGADTDDRARGTRDRWDVVVAGSSFASMFFILALPRNLRILVLEKGARERHEDMRNLYDDLYEPLDIENSSGSEKEFVAHTVFGGNSNCWAGNTPRFHPSDFELRERYGVGVSWPVSYDDLEADYVTVERIMEVSGGGDDHLFPRSAPLPYPPHAMTRADILCHQARPDIWVPCPTARSNGGLRPTCCANLMCKNCPIDAKYTILNGFPDFDRPGLTVMTGAEVRAVDMEAGRARGVTARTSDGVEFAVSADAVALGTNAIFNAAILLRSGITSESLGHYLHEEAGRLLTLDIAVPGLFGGSLISSFCYGAYDGPHRSEVAAVLIESHNTLFSPRTETGRWTDRMTLVMVADDLPQRENAVFLDSEGNVRITWNGHSEYAHAGLDRAESMLPDFLPFEIEAVSSRTELPTLYHIQGTHRMGSNPATSVVDGSLRVHGYDNLFALGSGAFPTCSPANPTLTLSAFSLRAGRSL